ncbi:MAG TPA: universal stress protein [Candidatus Acidoferrales bacterium]|nr:universal stress protein [Candidatus Acidoferrales bacterium]
MNVLLAIDESEFSAAALRTVIAQIPAKGSAVHVLHVVAPLERYLTESVRLIEAMEAAHAEAVRRGKDLVAGARQALAAAGFEVAADVAEGDPRSVIVERAERGKADLIVVGSHGRSGWKRLLLGSVSEAVARYAHCSVLIVRPPTVDGARAA